jgi:hypothetical protein
MTTLYVILVGIFTLTQLFGMWLDRVFARRTQQARDAIVSSMREERELLRAERRGFLESLKNQIER